ncbi:MAG: hypothetical protein ACXWZS_14020 [Gemmatirosa sp.]
MISSLVARSSAAVLLVGGLALIFASDVLLPALVPGYPVSGAWLGQLLGAAWLGVATLNWLQRGALLGGIYGRPVVLANLVLYVVGALSLLRALREPGAPRAMWGLVVPAVLLAVVYGVLLLRGPLDRLESDDARGAPGRRAAR